MASPYMDLFIEAVIAIALFPVLTTFVANANVTGVGGTLLSLIPILYIIVLVAAFAYAVKNRSQK